MEAENVKCVLCGWRGRRTYEACECDYMCGCTGYGRCPKCHCRVDTVRWLREHARNQKRAEAWQNSPEGKARMAELVTKVT